MEDALLAAPSARLQSLLPNATSWLDLTGGVSREAWAGRAELGHRFSDSVVGFVAGQVGSTWADPTVDVRGEVGLRVAF